MSPEQFNEVREELETMRNERFAVRSYQQKLLDHPSCQDPDHPGCDTCADEDWDYGQRHAND